METYCLMILSRSGHNSHHVVGLNTYISGAVVRFRGRAQPGFFRCGNSSEALAGESLEYVLLVTFVYI